ncbi:MAG: acetylxylan esterase [bacterium]
MKPNDFDQFWAGIESDLNSVVPEPELKELPIRSKPQFTVYGLWLSSVKGYRIFAYYSVPRGEGPFPVIYHLPNYGSVVHIPPFEERCKYICVALCHRGQRLSDEPFAAAYPGLLTLGIEAAESYIYREIAGDCLSVMDFLKSREEVDGRRICLLGGELALWTAARRSEAAALHYTPALHYNSLKRASQTTNYPLEEFNDHLRGSASHRLYVEKTLSYFEPVHHAPQVKMPTMLVEDSVGFCDALAETFAGPVDRVPFQHSSYRDGVRQANWIADKLDNGQPILPAHWC